MIHGLIHSECRFCPVRSLQSPKKVLVRSLVNFLPAVAYLFCLNLPAALSQPRTKTFFGALYTSSHATYQYTYLLVGYVPASAIHAKLGLHVWMLP